MSEKTAEKILIGGKWVRPSSQRLIEIKNPATLDFIACIAECDEQDVNAAVDAARAAQREWDKTPGLEKAALLHEVARRIRQSEQELAGLMCRETGKPIWEALDCIEWVAACFDYYAEIGRSSRGQSLPPVARHQ